MQTKLHYTEQPRTDRSIRKPPPRAIYKSCILHVSRSYSLSRYTHTCARNCKPWSQMYTVCVRVCVHWELGRGRFMTVAHTGLTLTPTPTAPIVTQINQYKWSHGATGWLSLFTSKWFGSTAIIRYTHTQWMCDTQTASLAGNMKAQWRGNFLLAANSELKTLKERRVQLKRSVSPGIYMITWSSIIWSSKQIVSDAVLALLAQSPILHPFTAVPHYWRIR